jgi:hypothetical protein
MDSKISLSVFLVDPNTPLFRFRGKADRHLLRVETKFWVALND